MMTVADPTSYQILIDVSAAEWQRIVDEANARKVTPEQLAKERVLSAARGMPSASVIQTTEEKKAK